MANTVMLQVRMDADLKKEAEELFESMGTSLPEVVRMFARKSVDMQSLPFELSRQKKNEKVISGLAEGMFKIPESIDSCNDEIAEMFGVE